MAEIPVQRKSGVAWWMWVLPLVVLALLLMFGMRGCDRTAAVGDGDANDRARITAEGVGTTTGARVTDPALFGSTADKLALVGREAELQNVRVSRVLSDRVFTVTAGTGEMFVMLADSLNRGAAEAAVQARPGQTVHLGGRFERVGDQETRDEKSRGLNASEAQQMAGQQIYLHATSARNAQ